VSALSRAPLLVVVALLPHLIPVRVLALVLALVQVLVLMLAQISTTALALAAAAVTLCAGWSRELFCSVMMTTVPFIPGTR
jgi:hypothetical protein